MADKIKPTGITSVLTENRFFRPQRIFQPRAYQIAGRIQKLYNESIRSPEKYWAKQAKKELIWFSPWKKVLEWKTPICEMVRRRPIERELQLPRPWPGTPTANKAAIIWEGEPGGARKSRRSSHFHLQTASS